MLKYLLNPASLIDPNTPDDEKNDLSIFSTALKVVILNVSGSGGIGPSLVSKALPYILRKIEEDHSADDMDVLISLIERFGSSFTSANISQTETCLLELLQKQSGIIQKRAIVALGHLSRYLRADVYSKLLEYILTTLKASISSTPTQTTKTMLLLSNTIAKSDVSKFKPYLTDIIPLIVASNFIDKLDDEDANENTDLADTREAALTHIETIIIDFGSHSISPYIEEFLTVAKAFLRYDPNFVQDEEESEEEALFSTTGDVDMDDADDSDDNEDEEDDSDSEFDDEGFSDDDDQTWKLRRISAKLIAGLVATSPMSLSLLYSEILRPVIVSTIKEREDSVKVVSLEAFSALVEAASSDRYYYATRQNYGHKRKSSDVSMNNSADPQSMLVEVLPIVVKNFLKILTNKREKTTNNIKHGILTSLRSLNNVVRLPDGDLGSILSAASELAVSGSPYMSDILQLANSVLVHNPTQHLLGLFDIILDIIVSGIKDQYYRISGEALDTTQAIFPHYSKPSASPAADTTSLQEALKAKVAGNSFDIDIRKKAILGLAALVQRVNLTDVQSESAIGAICGQLENDLLRSEVLKAVRTFITPLSIAHFVPSANISHISTKWVVTTQTAILPFLLQSQASVRAETLLDLRSLSQLVSNRIIAGEVDNSDASLFISFLNQLLERVQQTVTDYSVVKSGDSTLRSQVDDYQTQLSSELQLFADCFEGLQTVSPDILDSIVIIFKQLLDNYQASAASSTTNSIAASPLESALLSFFGKYTRSLSEDKIQDFYSDLLSSKNSSSSLISAVAGLTIAECGLDSEISKFVSVIQKAAETEYNAIDVDLTIRALQIVGFVGRNKPLDQLGISLEPVYALLSSDDAEGDYIAVTSAQTIGKATIGGLRGYLPELLEKLMAPSDAVHKKYLYLTALRSVVVYLQTEGEKYKQGVLSSGNRATDLSDADSIKLLDGFPYLSYVSTIWTCLLKISFEDDKSQGGEKAVVAECLGRLSIISPEISLPELKLQLSSPEVSVRRSVISAIRYTLGQPTDAQYDRLLRPMVVDFLVLLEDPNLSIRQIALSTLMSAIRNKPTLLLPHLSRLLPLLYKETYKNPALVRIVQMGPFKHEVDDGLELRKSAYDAMFHIVTSLPHEWQVNLLRDEEFTDRVFAGLSDDHDIRLLSCVTLGRMTMVDIRFLTFRSGAQQEGSADTGEDRFVQNLDRLIEKFSAILKTTINDNAVKQEHEKQSELVRNIYRTCAVIEEAITLAVEALNASASGSSEAAAVALNNLHRLAQRASNNAGSTSDESFSYSASSNSNGVAALISAGGVRSAVRATVGLTDSDIGAWHNFYQKLKDN